MSLYDFVEMAVDSCYSCYIWDNNLEEEIFKGTIDDIPEELLEREITSWEMYEGMIGFNID